MQYLLQSVELHSKAERLFLSFPATTANYSKAIEQLKERFGRDDLLVQIYKENYVLFFRESLGRTQEKHGDFLIPLVESCLPEETLLDWERSLNHESTQNTRSLEHLMNFLRKEVQGEEVVQLARTGFGPQYNFQKNNTPVECVIQSELATASALVSLDSGADVMGRLLRRNVVTLHSGLTSVESKLSWTVFGKQKFWGKNKFRTTLSMHVGNIPLKNLRELEVLEITDPT
ncbi:uncharacterized protein TNCV_1787181 [Trichonephila clavipes]|nr:uncharacterized protein TNCV_1787181 [Trichonephila clavipes]